MVATGRPPDILDCCGPSLDGYVASFQKGHRPVIGVSMAARPANRRPVTIAHPSPNLSVSREPNPNFAVAIPLALCSGGMAALPRAMLCVPCAMVSLLDPHAHRRLRGKSNGFAYQ